MFVHIIWSPYYAGHGNVENYWLKTEMLSSTSTIKDLNFMLPNLLFGVSQGLVNSKCLFAQHIWFLEVGFLWNSNLGSKVMLSN